MKIITKEEIIKKSTHDLPILRGVYFLINKTENIVYIGKSENCYKRIKTHKSNNKKAFVRYFILEVSKSENLEETEKKYINDFKPFYNKKDNPEYEAFNCIIINKNRKGARNGGRPKGITDRLKVLAPKAAQMYNQQVSNSIICEELSISPGSLYKCLKHMKVKLHVNRK